MLMVGTAAMIMLGGTGFAFYTFRTSLTAALGDPDKASAFLGPDAAASLDRLILGEMLEIALICLPVGLAFLGMAYVLAMGVKRPLKALQNGLDGLSQGDFKIEIAGADRGDEIGSIARSVAGFREKLAEKAVEDARQAMAQQEDMARQRADTLRQVAHDFETSVVSVVQRLSTAAQRVGGLSNDLDGAVDQASQAVGIASDSSQQASSSVATAAEAAEEMTQSILAIGRDMEESAKMAQAAVDESRSTDAIVGRLAESGRAIGEVVDLIKQIADQTNLLALNATIEAARAGEAGRGFAIVAQEVKQLASQTSKATEDIANQVSEVQAATTRAVDTIGSISSTVGEIDTLTAAIAAAIEEQGAATREISMNVQHAAQGTMTLTRNVSGVNDAIDKTEHAAEDFLSVSGSLRTQSTEIAEQIRGFFVEIREGALDRRKGRDPNYKGPDRRAEARKQSAA